MRGSWLVIRGVASWPPAMTGRRRLSHLVGEKPFTARPLKGPRGRYWAAGVPYLPASIEVLVGLQRPHKRR